MHKVSRTMSTQHPDNVAQPFFANNAVLEGEDEIKEAFYAFSHLNCNEQLWDCEGKEVDNFVVQKLLTKYPDYFSKHILGKEKMITLRLPNPTVQKTDAKILLEALHSIPRNFDINNLFYNNLQYKEEISPIQEVYIPMVTTAKEVIRVSEYYQQYVIKAQNNAIMPKDISIADWLGKSLPNKIRVTPLIETTEGMLAADKIAKELILHEKPTDYQRIWLARSDPALNYGSLSAVIINKVSLQKLQDIEDEMSIDILPILGCGSAPFRGNLTPQNTERIIKGYPSVHTFTLQSSFKYDHPLDEVKNAVTLINETKRKKPVAIDEEKALIILNKIAAEYQKTLPLLVPMIDAISPMIPKRRKRHLHIGLFGYSRASAGLKLPRAITFCASLYSAGLPPELLGLSCLTEKEKEFIKTFYPSFDFDTKEALQYLNIDNLKYFPKEISAPILKITKEYKNDSAFEINQEYKKITSILMENLKNNHNSLVAENIVQAAFKRGFLG